MTKSSKTNVATTNQGKTRYAEYYIARNPETYEAIGDVMRISVISSYSDAPELFDIELKNAREFAIKQWHYPSNIILTQYEDENYPPTTIECDADEFRYND